MPFFDLSVTAAPVFHLSTVYLCVSDIVVRKDQPRSDILFTCVIHTVVISHADPDSVFTFLCICNGVLS